MMGLYATYVRLARNRRIYGMSIVDIANACRMSKTTVKNLNAQLEACGFIKVDVPTSFQRYKHYTIEITVLDAPCEIPPEVQRDYEPPRGYEPLSRWLVQDAKDKSPVLTGTSPSTNQPENGLSSTAKIASCIASSLIDPVTEVSNTR